MIFKKLFTNIEKLSVEEINHFKDEDNVNYKKIIFTAIFFISAFFLGASMANITNINHANKLVSSNNVLNASEANWGLGFPVEGQTPIGNTSSEELEKFDAYYIGNTNNKTIYLTFDAGFENGFTPKILDDLKKHNVRATFFLVGNYIKTCPEIVKRIVDEGHSVGNHTYNHP
ncbi:MAG TPA: polysaccharide deacetylase family protein, partial [Clostridiales bacterium]|nr:polysaccharide deacetylase family protein [Clostridiales bacterium]